MIDHSIQNYIEASRRQMYESREQIQQSLTLVHSMVYCPYLRIQRTLPDRTQTEQQWQWAVRTA